jgi:hypothetical protein
MQTLKDRPEDFALFAADPRFPAQPGDVAIGLARLQLPSVDDLRPFTEKEMRREFMAADFLGCLGRIAMQKQIEVSQNVGSNMA